MTNKKVDAVIIGGGLSGLIAAYVLSGYGMKSILIEKGKTLGGGNNSFFTGQGNVFDYGYHALDYMRSSITTKLFNKVIHGKCQVLELNRAIIIDDYIIPYNAPLIDWPEKLQKLFEIKSDSDSVSHLLNRTEIAKSYGTKFTDFAFDEILKSYPSEKWSLENGSDEAEHAETVYPWFFPKLDRQNNRSSETDVYHDSIRKKGIQHIMYPDDGGFDGFIKGLHNSIDNNYCEIKIEVDALEFNFNENNVTLESVKCEGVIIEADHFFWCAPPSFLLKTFNKLNIKGLPQRIVLGSFVVENEIQYQHHEILVGNSAHKINRISFPGLLGKRVNKQIQVEFYFPNGDYQEDQEFWFKTWNKSLDKLGLLSNDNKIIEKDFRTEIRGVVTKENLKDITEKSIKDLDETGTNIVVPYFNFGPENINRIVPGVIDNVTRIISGDYSR